MQNSKTPNDVNMASPQYARKECDPVFFAIGPQAGSGQRQGAADIFTW
jgi:hypothetical protein